MSSEFHRVESADVESWHARTADLAALTRSLSWRDDSSSTLLGDRLPHHLRFAIEQLARVQHVAAIAKQGPAVPADTFDSISFHGLCRGLLLPLAAMAPERAAQLFGLVVEPTLDGAGREVLLERFLDKDVGLDITQKLSCLLGDPFRGRRSTFRRDSMLRLLLSLELEPRRTLLDRLAQVGDVAILFAQSRDQLKSDPALTAAEVLETLRFLPDVGQNQKLEVLRSLLTRCGRLEAYFLAKLLLRKAGFGFEYQGQLLAHLLAGHFKVPEEQLSHAMALTDAFHLVDLLVEEGPDALRKIQLQPLVAVQPALASGSSDEVKTFPVWVERKYDGIRLLLHKATDTHGSILCGAYTRNRGDWLELVNGLESTIKAIPARTAIVDGELYGTTAEIDGPRPATVYEVYSMLQGQGGKPVNLRYAAFDLLYLNGADVTAKPLRERRGLLQSIIQPLASYPLPVPLTLSEGQLAAGKDDVLRLYQHFRAQGHEGLITKDFEGPYRLATRDPSWLKKKPVITLDLVLLGAVLAVTSKTNTGMFGSYVIGAKTPEGTFDDVGDVAGVDRVRDAEIQHEIMKDGLLTGRRIERKSASGVRPGLELRPALVVTVKFEGIVRDNITGKLSLRDPKLAVIRSDKSVFEADGTKALEEMYLRQRMG